MVRPILATAFSLLIASPAALAADAKQMEENKKIVAAFYDAAVNQKDFEKASQYLGARYTQHNPLAADGREGFKGFIAFLKEKFPNNRSEIKRIFAIAITSSSTCMPCASRARAATPSSTFSSSRTARWSSIGT
jgi:hypothetical protein